MKRCKSCGKLRPPGSFQSPEPVCATCWATPPPPLNPESARTLLRDWARGLSSTDQERTIETISEAGGRLCDALKLAAKEGKEA